MSRRSIIEDIEKEHAKEGEVVRNWSKKRIAIAIVSLFILLIVGVYYLDFFIKSESHALQEKVANEKPEIAIPDQQKITDILNNAKSNLSNIDASNVASSQPQLQKIINDLKQITTASQSAKSLVCSTICK